MRITLLIVSLLAGLGAWVALARALRRSTLAQLEEADAERNRDEAEV